jgi:RsiW-degrading membrane proteinase PrsW (M82 family)
MSLDNPPRRGRWGWLRVLGVGIVLFILATVIMYLTGNLNLYPTVILIGNFLVPVVFVAFLYDYQHISSLTPETIAKSFCLGGILGVLGASILETLFIPVPADLNKELPLTSAFGVGLIEEGCKLLAILFLARHMSHNKMIDGLLLGAAVGMGFAALESTGYAFSMLLTSRGHIDTSIGETIFRGLLAPFGHGTWSAILGAALFQQSAPRRFRITWPVILVYLFVSLLHGLWDGFPFTIYFVIAPGVRISVVFLVLSIIGIAVLFGLYIRARKQPAPLSSSPTPPAS